MQNETPNPQAVLDAATFDRLIEAAGPAALLVAIEDRMSIALRQRMSCEDIWQETLGLAWRDRAGFRWQGMPRFRAWLIAIATNRIRDAADRETAQKRGGQEGAPLPLDPISTGASEGQWALTSTTPSRVAALREEAEAMRTVLATLPDRFREILRLRVFEEVPVLDIAMRLGLSTADVKHRLREGSGLYRDRLRQLLESGRTESNKL